MITRSQYDAVLFDLDGVITNTASIHGACWKEMFDEYLQQRATARGEAFRPAEVLPENLPMLKVFERCGLAMTTRSERGVHVTLALSQLAKA